MRANFLVRSDELITHLWEDRPPADGRAALQVHVTRLRRFLNCLQDGQEAVISTLPGGYLIEVSPDRLDVSRFQRIAKQAISARNENDVVAESTLLQQALALWRGTALADVPSHPLQQDLVPALVEQRLRLAERWFDIELKLGHHADVIGTLRELLAEHPLRERLWGRLMVALYRCERQAEALQAYHSVARLLNEELGIAPGEQLSQLHQAILNGDPALAAAPSAEGRAVEVAVSEPASASHLPAIEPDGGEVGAVQSGTWLKQCQLPSDADDLVGRSEVVTRMVEMLVPRRPSTAVPVVRLSGSPGAGKTVLAVRVAHLLRPEFPDGQWYVPLGGAGDQPRRPADVLTELLCASGMNATAIPEGLDARAAVFRARLADRRVLLVLDDANDAEQVMPLLPGTAGCGVVVTSRSQLPELVALSGARPIAVDVLSPDEAVTVLTRVLGADRVRAEEEAAAEVARLCACLPLALRVAAANLAGRPTRTITEYVAELRRGNLLGKLAAGYESRTAVRAAFDLSYRTLPPALRRLFRLLGLAPGPELTVSLAAQLADVEDEEAERLLNGLADAHLVEPLGVGRFRFHDLLRLYAAERADVEETEEERDEALRRLYDWYLHTSNAAQRMCCLWFIQIPLPDPIRPARTGTFADPEQALAWLKAERPNLVAMIVRAADGAFRHYSWLLADILVGYFSIDRHYDDWLVTARAALRAATEHGDAYAIGVTQLGMGLVTAYFLADSTSAISHFRNALQQFKKVGTDDFEAVALNAVAMLHLHKNHGRLDDAVPLLEQALSIAERQGARPVEMETLRNLGVLHHARGDLQRSAEYLTRALEVCREVSLPNVAPDLLARLGLVNCDRGLFDPAVDNLTEALAISVRLNAVNLQSVAHYGLALAHARSCRQEEAERHVRQALELAASVQFQAVEVNCLNLLGHLERTRGMRDQARNHFARGLALARQVGHEQAELDAVIGLAMVGGDDHRTALGHADHALVTARRSGFRLQEGRALTVLAGIHGRMGDRRAAREFDRQARQVFIETGHGPRRLEVCDPPGAKYHRDGVAGRPGRPAISLLL